MSTKPQQKEQLTELFGSYKAEWLQGRIYEFFTEPAYFPDLVAPRPCMLIGGRGTGKTTVLRSLSFEGQFALSGQNSQKVKDFKYYGFYYRVNTNRVTAFVGEELKIDLWIKLFGHYMNLILTSSVFNFLSWYSLHNPGFIGMGREVSAKIAESLALDSVSSFEELRSQTQKSLVKFEAFLNNINDYNFPRLSLQGAPVDELMSEIKLMREFKSKTFFFLIDEYENFTDYQQTIVNTLIKHCGENYSFKVGVRELGWRKKSTLNSNEQLISPSDYVRIRIEESLAGATFEQFARSVCNARLQSMSSASSEGVDIASILPSMTDEEEAELLGVSDAKDRIKSQMLPLSENIDSPDVSELYKYFLYFWAQSNNEPLREVLISGFKKNKEWIERYENYKHALLYTISGGKSGIQKYYCGWSTYVSLSGNNIRYLLELVVQSLSLHMRNDKKTLFDPVSFEDQTRAAQYIGRKNLSELEGLSVYGAQLTKLLLGLGRVFGIMATQLAGHRPEVNQFHLSEHLTGLDTDALRLLDAAVMHLALIRTPGNKLADEGDTRAHDYIIHPIYAPFFVFSYRKKRKMMLSGAELLGLVRSPREAIRSILKKSKRQDGGALPEQLLLFEGYYGRGS